MVIGGSSGLGRAAALALAEAGAVNGLRAEAVALKYSRDGADLCGMPTDPIIIILGGLVSWLFW